VPPTDAGDVADEELQQRLHPISEAIADAHRRGDKEAAERLEAYYRLVITDYRWHRRGLEADSASQGIDPPHSDRSQ
jgi:hypothetical protein